MSNSCDGIGMMLPSLAELSWLQGSPSELTHPLQLMLMIQPNCPGCHMHSVPLVNKLEACKRDFDVYCISTAFEDFDHNNYHTASLLLQGWHVGVSKAQLGERVQHIPTVPFAHDIVTPKVEANEDLKIMALAATKASARKQLSGWVPPGVLETHLAQISYDVLPEKIPQFFYRVHALGTPSWVLHKSDGEVLGVKFGQVSQNDLVDWVKENGGMQTDGLEGQRKD
jgi:hypothetical protein